MKKTTIAALALAGLALAGGAGLYAGRQLTRSRAIGGVWHSARRKSGISV